MAGSGVGLLSGGIRAMEIARLRRDRGALRTGHRNKQIRGALWLFAPAAIFTVVHFWFIPKSASGPYVLSLDSRLPSTIASYLAWTFEPGSSRCARTRNSSTRRNCFWESCWG